MARILVVEDDPAIGEMIAFVLARQGHEVQRAHAVAQARTALANHQIHLVISDIYMPGEDGLVLLEELRRTQPQLPVILITARGSVETVAFAARTGAFDYLAKPFDVRVLLEKVEAALHPLATPPPQPPTAPQSMIIGSHPSIVEVYKAIARVAPLQVPVLIRGETGTGKELVARALHRFGRNPQGPFVAVNCGALPDTLLESELFGFVRGAFTDARRDHRGAIPRAAGGTLFLDEVGDVSPAFQVKLLRFLEDGEVIPVGAEAGSVVDVRAVAATHHPLPELIRAGSFREDLYFRLAGYEIRLPPLRERLEDLPLLVEHFRVRLATDLGLPPPGEASPEVLAVLASYHWPGNIRELQRVIGRCLIDGRTLRDPGLVQRILREMGVAPTAPSPPAPAPPFTPTSLAEAERRHILAVLAATGGNRSAAARILGIERKTLARKLRSLGMLLADPSSGREDS